MMIKWTFLHTFGTACAWKEDIWQYNILFCILTVGKHGTDARIQEFSSGGGSRSVWQKSSDNDFFSPQLILQKSNGQFQRNLSFFKAPDWVLLFPGGVQLLIPYRNPFNLRFSRGGPDPLPPPLWIRTWCSPHSIMVKATIHYLIWAWQTLIDRRMYHPFIVIYLIISVYYRNLRCFNRWQLYISFNNVSYFGWSLALFPIKRDCRGLNCHFNLLLDILCELRYRRLCFIEKWPKYSIIIRYATLLHRIGDNREGSEQSMNVDRKSLEFTICRQSGKQTAIQNVCFWWYLIYVRR